MVVQNFDRVAGFASGKRRKSNPVASAKTQQPIIRLHGHHREKFAAGTLSTKEGFPQGFEDVIQKTAVARLAASKLFEKVIDATEPAVGAANGSSAPAE